jgi:hypothetical protein
VHVGQEAGVVGGEEGAKEDENMMEERRRRIGWRRGEESV